MSQGAANRSSARRWSAEVVTAAILLLVFALGAAFCIVAILVDPSAFFRAWLAAYLFWLGVPLCGVTLVLVHDLTGGEWMETVPEYEPYEAGSEAKLRKIPR